MIKLSTSLLAANPIRLFEEVQYAKELGVDEIHYDVMDGHFVPNLTFGVHTLATLKKEIPLVYDVHLMLANPLHHVDAFLQAGADILTVHLEAGEPEACIAKVRKFGAQVGLSIKPQTPTKYLLPFLSQVDRVLIMTVEPGFGGQALITDVLPKAQELRNLGFTGEIEADGGITMENAHILAHHGFTVLVVGTGFFKAENPQSVVHTLHHL